MAKTRQARKCTARRSDGTPCGAYAIRGAEVCRAHGGSSPAVTAAAADRVLDERANRALARLDAEPCDDPLAALAEVAGQVLAWKDSMAEQLDRLEELRYSATGAGTEQLRAEVALYERAMDRAVKVLGVIAHLDIDNRLARISEQQADVVARAVQAGLDHAGVTGTPAAEARAVVARHLRSVAGGRLDG